MIANEAGGFITVDSTVGKGTTFKVHLPAHGMVTPRTAPQRSAAVAAGRHILVVEDLAAVAELIVASLRAAGHDPVVVTGTRAAAQVIASEPVDLLLTDVNLPDGSGTVLARTARAMRPGLRVILMSGTGDLPEEFDATLAKPFDDAALLAVVHRVLNEDGPAG
jgi:DNA-binding NtrC family response regulator